jgi:protein-S-isoprenylcysteine O-methyltransferase Ste14
LSPRQPPGTTLTGAAYGWHIRAEERMLVAALDEQYRCYQRHTARLVPFLY